MPDGRPVPGTWAGPDELLAFGDVLGRAGEGLFEGAMRLGERDDESLTKTRAEVALMGDISRRSGRPVSYGLVQSNRRPDLYAQVIDMTKAENANGAAVRPQTTARAASASCSACSTARRGIARQAFRDLHDAGAGRAAGGDP